jgi:Fe-S-cluster formation regulator IscX/YfhJ
MAYGRSNALAGGLVRFVIAFGIIAIIFTVMGMIDLGKDAFGSHGDFTTMETADFKSGDIVHGRITETLGCAATMETTETMMYVVETDKYTSAVYYVIPFFDDIDDAYPNKIIFYKTGNKAQMSALEALEDETMYWYAGQRDGTSTRIDVDRAEVVNLNSEEREAMYEYLDEFIDVYYSSESSQTKDYLKIAYHDAAVPYLIEYNAGGGNIMLTIGLVMLAVFVIGLIIVLMKKKRADTYVPQHTYVGAASAISNDPNLNSPTGLMNASERFYGGGTGTTGGTAAPGGARPGQTGVPPYIAGGTTRPNSSMPPYMQGNRTGTGGDRPMPSVAPAQQNMGQRQMNFDPYTGRPIDNRAGGAQAPIRGGYAQRSQQNRQIQIKSEDSMPSVDPKTEENVDLSNGGISWEEKAQRNMGMPTNGAVPVINPEGQNAATMFGEVIPVEAETHAAPEEPEPEPELVNGKVTEIHPPTKEDNIKSDFQVSETDKETRNIYSHMTGGQMNEVDPYTEKNVDLSNGGVELPESEDDDLRRSFDNFVQPSAPAPSYPTAEPVQPSQPAPAPEPVQPAPAPEPAQPDDYNIFKTGGSSYNIFRDDAPKTDSAANMGFPVENKEFPKVDTSFPEAGESDIGGKDDFIF